VPEAGGPTGFVLESTIHALDDTLPPSMPREQKFEGRDYASSPRLETSLHHHHGRQDPAYMGLSALSAPLSRRLDTAAAANTALYIVSLILIRASVVFCPFLCLLSLVLAFKSFTSSTIFTLFFDMTLTHTTSKVSFNS
jgi:hypothetical protein